jgi:hypothetical protein
MNDTELKNLLESYNHKLEEARVLNLQSWVLNLQCFETLQSQKAKSKLRSLLTFKVVAVILGVLWVIFLGYLLYHSLQMSKIFFVISAGAVMLFTILAIIVYTWQIVLIGKINNSNNVLDTQEKIVRLQLSTLNVTRILFLPAPFYCTFWWNMQMMTDSPLSFWLISFPVALFFILATVWLYRNISFKNVNKRWFKILFDSPEWTSLLKAKNFLEEIESFKRNM